MTVFFLFGKNLNWDIMSQPRLPFKDTSEQSHETLMVFTTAGVVYNSYCETCISSKARKPYKNTKSWRIWTQTCSYAVLKMPVDGNDIGLTSNPTKYLKQMYTNISYVYGEALTSLRKLTSCRMGIFTNLKEQVSLFGNKHLYLNRNFK